MCCLTYSITRAHYGGRPQPPSRPERAPSRRCQQQKRCALLTMAPRTEQQRQRRADTRAIHSDNSAMPERSVANRSFLMPRVGPIVGQLSDVAQRFMTLVSSDRGRSTHQPVPASIKGSGIARGALTMSPRTEEQLRRRANNARRRYTSKRLSSLKQRFPLMPPDVLERATLRQVSVAVRRIGDGQSALSAFKPGESSSGSISNTLALDSD